MKKLLVLFMMVAVFSISSNAQTWKALSTGSTSDTLSENETFVKTFKVISVGVPTVSIQVFIDSVSGVPGATATLYQSLDNINWETTGVVVTYLNGSDTTFYMTDTSFQGLYGKLEIVGSGTTQRQQIRSTKMQWETQ